MILLIFIALLALIIALDTLKLGISPMPTSKLAREKIVASIDANKRVLELGSGWGGVSLALAKKTSVRAFEKALVPWCFSLLRGAFLPSKPKLLRKDFFKEPFSNADVIYCYLYPNAMQRLAPKFAKELSRGAIVYSNSFQIPGKKPMKIIDVGDWMRSKIYIYEY